MLLQKRTIFFSIAVAAVVAALFYFSTTKSTMKFPVIGQRGGEFTAASELLNVQEAIEQYRYKIRNNPALSKNYTRLAQLYLQQGRITGRHHAYVAQAQELLDQALQLEPSDLEAIINQAAIFMVYHKFEAARDWAKRATKMKPDHALAWGLYSDALKELGEYEDAVAACDEMLSIRPDLRSYSRASHLREIHGDLAGARKAMHLAANAGVIGLESHAWALYQLGSLYFKEGKVDTAEFIYRGILQSRTDYPHAWHGLSEVEKARANYSEAIQHSLRAFRLAPEHEFMENLVALYRSSGREEASDAIRESVLLAFYEHEKNGWNVNLELARFCLNNNIELQEALVRAGKEYHRRPNHVEVKKIYQRALFKNNRPDEAALLQKQKITNMGNAPLTYQGASG